MSQEDETLVVVEKPKRAPRKRVAKVVSEDEISTPKKRVPRKQVEAAPRRVVRRKSSDDGDAPSSRKAPTPLASEKTRTRKSRKQRFVVIGLLLVGIASSAAVGFTDKGTINVEATITARNEQSRAAGREGEIVPVQNTDVQPDGGLIGLVGTDSSKPAEVTASTTQAVSTTSAPVGNIPMTAQDVQQTASQETAPTESAQ